MSTTLLESRSTFDIKFEILLRRYKSLLNDIKESPEVKSSARFDYVRGSLILASDYCVGLANDDSVGEVMKETAALKIKGIDDVTLVDSLRAAKRIAQKVGALYAENPKPVLDDVKFPPFHLTSSQLFVLLYN